MLRPRPSSRFQGSVHLYLRVHLLLGLRCQEAWLRLRELRRRVGAKAGASGCEVTEESAIDRAGPSTRAVHSAKLSMDRVEKTRLRAASANVREQDVIRMRRLRFTFPVIQKSSLYFWTGLTGFTGWEKIQLIVRSAAFRCINPVNPVNPVQAGLIQFDHGCFRGRKNNSLNGVVRSAPSFACNALSVAIGVISGQTRLNDFG
jgi:hypothetical protein